jgi:hypothetical protein
MITLHQSARHHIPEDSNPHIQCSENFKSHWVTLLLVLGWYDGPPCHLWNQNEMYNIVQLHCWWACCMVNSMTGFYFHRGWWADLLTEFTLKTSVCSELPSCAYSLFSWMCSHSDTVSWSGCNIIIWSFSVLICWVHWIDFLRWTWSLFWCLLNGFITWEIHIEMMEPKAFRAFIRVYSLFRSERLSLWMAFQMNASDT